MTFGDTEELIRLRAYALRHDEGRPEGREHGHRERARREIQGAPGPLLPNVPSRPVEEVTPESALSVP